MDITADAENHHRCERECAPGPPSPPPPHRRPRASPPPNFAPRPPAPRPWDCTDYCDLTCDIIEYPECRGCVPDDCPTTATVVAATPEPALEEPQWLEDFGVEENASPPPRPPRYSPPVHTVERTGTASVYSQARDPFADPFADRYGQEPASASGDLAAPSSGLFAPVDVDDWADELPANEPRPHSRGGFVDHFEQRLTNPSRFTPPLQPPPPSPPSPPPPPPPPLDLASLLLAPASCALLAGVAALLALLTCGRPHLQRVAELHPDSALGQGARRLLAWADGWHERWQPKLVASAMDEAADAAADDDDDDDDDDDGDGDGENDDEERPKRLTYLRTDHVHGRLQQNLSKVDDDDDDERSDVGSQARFDLD